MPRKPKDIVGNRYDRLLVEYEVPSIHEGVPRYMCLCDCGNKKEVDKYQLTRGAVRSCGCLAKEIWAELMKSGAVGGFNKKHGMRGTRLYSIINGIKERCYNPNRKVYKDYGGRGIIVCDEWLNDYGAFCDWAIQNGYNDTLTIDRIDNNGNYCPENCRWVTMKKQSNNRRNNKLIEYKGETKTISEWCDIFGIDKKLFYHRYNESHWPLDKVFNTPVRGR